MRFLAACIVFSYVSFAHGHAGIETLALQYWKLSLENLQKSTFVGLFAGGQSDTDASSEVTGGRYNYGFGLYYFDIPVIDFGGIKKRLLKVGKRALRKEIRKAGRRRSKPGDVKKYEKQIKAAFEKEFNRIMAGNEVSMWPDASFTFLIEGTTGTNDGLGPELRLGLGMGISKFFISPTLAGEFGEEDFSLLFGLEVATGIVMRPISESLLFVPFVRYEARTIDDEPKANQMVAGGRFLWDWF